MKRILFVLFVVLGVSFMPAPGVAMQPGEGGGHFQAVCLPTVERCCWAGVPPLCIDVPCEKCDIYWVGDDGSWSYVTTVWEDCCDPDPPREV